MDKEKRQKEIKSILEMGSDSSIAMLSEVFKFPLTRTSFKVHDSNGVCVLDLRSWGYLTGRGHLALGLDDKTAAAAQDKFGDEIVSSLNLLYESLKEQVK